MEKKALILFAHGARDPRWSEPFRRLQAITQAQRQDVRVELAFLELMEPRLPEMVAALAAQACTDVTVVPVFLGQGGHVLRDLPPLMDRLQAEHPALRLRAVAAVGEDESVLQALAGYCLRSLG